ncbi:MAG: hypothetical protein IJX81_05670 [Clostridia bacterium]|nr:hypothetical protein [Clostridia bacterium]
MSQNQNHAFKEELQKTEEKRKKAKAKEIWEDFLARKEARRAVESGWLLNLNFLSGNQYCDVAPYGGLAQEDKNFYWQSRRVFNHIAPTVDARMSKLASLTPTLVVKAFSDEDGDVQAAALATGVLKYAQDRIGFSSIVSRATLWAEACGSVFYKVLWNEKGGRQVGVDEENRPVYEGEVNVSVAPAFEVYPDRLDAECFEEIQSLIHAQVVPVSYIFERFGVAIEGRTIEELGNAAYSEPSAGKQPQRFGLSTTPKKDSEILIERYTRPSGDDREGRLEIVAGGVLLYEGPLPYLNEERGERGLPFVKQDCMRLPGAFFGVSIVDRLIPLQRAYNAVRNRKHEFLNRLSVGVLTVEDGSVDSDALAEEGLAPGKVIVYRQGGKAPELMEAGGIPAELEREEEWLEKEFSLVSGVSDLFQSSVPTGVTSATGLQLLLSQDHARIVATQTNIERAMEEVGRHILRLYKQFAGSARLMTMTGENKKTQVYYFNAEELLSSDIRFIAETPSSTPEQREILLKLFEAGLLSDDDGKVSKENKARILQAFGYGNMENAKDISALHAVKADEENLELKARAVDVDEYDDHEVHVLTHTRYLLSDDFKRLGNADAKKRIVEHLRKHRELVAIS